MLRPAGYYQQVPVNVKQMIIGSIFPGKLTFQEKKLRTSQTNQLVTLIASTINELPQKKTEQIPIIENLSCSVPGAGIEPAQPCDYWFLRPTRLPVPPSGQFNVIM
jgi:site-specific DNA recombinase